MAVAVVVVAMGVAAVAMGVAVVAMMAAAPSPAQAVVRVAAAVAVAGVAGVLFLRPIALVLVSLDGPARALAVGPAMAGHGLLNEVCMQ